MLTNELFLNALMISSALVPKLIETWRRQIQ